MASNSPIEVNIDSDTALSSTQMLDFDDDTLRAIAEVYMNDGNKEYREKQFNNAIDFYTEGLKVDCKDEELNAKLYSNRATAYFSVGNYTDTLSDVKATVKLRPTFIKAIVKGASACMELNRFDEALIWCVRGLDVLYKYKSRITMRTERERLQSREDQKREWELNNVKKLSMEVSLSVVQMNSVTYFSMEENLIDDSFLLAVKACDPG